MLGDCKKAKASPTGMVNQYQSLYDSFRWLVPTHFNIGQECCHRWANSSVDARRIALFYETHIGFREIWTYERLAATANQLANGLFRMGVRQGDRVALLMGQRPEAVVAHIACYSLGAVVVPFSPSCTTAFLEQRLRDAEARVAIFDSSSGGLLLNKLSRYPTLKQLIGIDVQDDRVLHWRNLMLRQPNTFKAVATRASDPAVLFYDADREPYPHRPDAIATKTSPEQSQTKSAVSQVTPPGIILSHAALLGNLPAFVASHNWFPRGAEVLWSDYAWHRAESLMQALLPTLYFGQSLLVSGESHPSTRVQELIQRYRVTSACMPSETLTSVQLANPSPDSPIAQTLHSIVTTGNPLTQEVIDWCKQHLNVTPNETFGSAAMGQILGNSHLKWPVRAGSMGKPYPGHQVALLDQAGLPVKPGETGEICLNRFDLNGHPDPALFSGFWRQEDLTEIVFCGDWYRSGLFAHMDEDGYYWSDPSKLQA